MESGGDILMLPEAEAYINSFSSEPFPIREIGSPKWMQYHEYLEKLSQQAVLSAATNQSEFVMQLLCEHDKVAVLIADLISHELWRENVFKIILKTNFSPKSTLPLYMVIYHEACVMNLLETIMYHKDALESGESALLDLVDYCQRQLVHLTSCKPSDTEVIYDTKMTVQGDDESDLQYLSRQSCKLRFECSVKCISLVRYFTDHLDALPVSVVSRLVKSEIVLLLVRLLEVAPWSVRKDGQLYKLIDQKWEEIPREDTHKLTNVEGQIWMALYQMLFSPETQNKNQITEHSKAQLMKLVSLLNDVVIDQMPALGQLKETLLRMQMQTFPDQPASTQPIIEQIPEIREKVESLNSGKWGAIAKHQIKNYFSPSDDDLRKLASNFAAMYDSDALDALIPGVPKCVVCAQDATKRCSRCKCDWYCSRECQLSHWPAHKQSCNPVQ